MPGNKQCDDREGPADEENRLVQIIISSLNLDLFLSATEDFENINWNIISRAIFHTGISVTLISSLMFAVILITNYLITPSIYDSIIRVASVGPLVPLLIAVFAYISRWSSSRLANPPPEEMTIKNNFLNLTWGRQSTLFLVSIFAIPLAIMMRFGHHVAAVGTFGSELSVVEVVSLMLLDGLFIGPLLIGVGGFGVLLVEA